MKPREDNNSWIRYIKQRITKNKNFLASISGPTGSGKTWTFMAIAEMLDPAFNIDRIVFKARDLLALINSGKLKPGSVILFDEAQIEMNSRNWQSTMNKLLNYLLTTFRHRCFILLFTSPYMDFLDSASLRLFHANFETRTINARNGTCTIHGKLLQYNQAMKKWYRKYLKVVKPGKGIVKIKKWIVPKPSKELIKLYEQKKEEFTKALNQDIQNKLEEFNKKEEPKETMEITCPKCNHTWNTRSKAPVVCCPSCFFKIFRSKIRIVASPVATTI